MWWHTARTRYGHLLLCICRARTAPLPWLLTPLFFQITVDFPIIGDYSREISVKYALLPWPSFPGRRPCIVPVYFHPCMAACSIGRQASDGTALVNRIWLPLLPGVVGDCPPLWCCACAAAAVPQPCAPPACLLPTTPLAPSGAPRTVKQQLSRPGPQPRPQP